MDTATRKSKVSAYAEYLPIVLRVRPVLDVSDDQLLELNALNPELDIERNAQGDLVIMPPEGFESSDRDAEITMQLRQWAKRDGTGIATGSSGGYRLPDTSVRGPDAAWILRSRVEQIAAEQRAKFLPACPDFVLELRSPSDRLAVLQAKMQEYLANGARLGWLLDPAPRHVYVYRPDAPVQRLDHPSSIAGDPVLPGFVLDLSQVW